MTVLTARDPLHRYILIVVFLYIFLLAGLYTASFFISGADSIKPGVKYNIIQSSIKVDVVSMPKMTLRELREYEASPEVGAKVEAVEKSNNDDDSFKEKGGSLFDTLKELSKKNIKTTTKVKKGKQKQFVDSKKLDKLILAGNKISKGSALTGSQNSEDLPALQSYLEELPKLIRPSWKLPSYLMGKDLRCRIRIYIGNKGDVLRTEIIESSGDAEYDQRALSAIMKSKLPAPDNIIASDLIRGVVILGFPL